MEIPWKILAPLVLILFIIFTYYNWGNPGVKKLPENNIQENILV